MWTFFAAEDSHHMLDKDFILTPGEVFLFSWNAVKGFNLDGFSGYLVFADPFLETTTLTANALQILGLTLPLTFRFCSFAAVTSWATIWPP